MGFVCVQAAAQWPCFYLLHCDSRAALPDRMGTTLSSLIEQQSLAVIPDKPTVRLRPKPSSLLLLASSDHTSPCWSSDLGQVRQVGCKLQEEFTLRQAPAWSWGVLPQTVCFRPLKWVTILLCRIRPALQTPCTLSVPPSSLSFSSAYNHRHLAVCSLKVLQSRHKGSFGFCIGTIDSSFLSFTPPF